MSSTDTRRGMRMRMSEITGLQFMDLRYPDFSIFECCSVHFAFFLSCQFNALFSFYSCAMCFYIYIYINVFYSWFCFIARSPEQERCRRCRLAQHFLFHDLLLEATLRQTIAAGDRVRHSIDRRILLVMVSVGTTGISVYLVLFRRQGGI